MASSSAIMIRVGITTSLSFQTHPNDYLNESKLACVARAELQNCSLLKVYHKNTVNHLFLAFAPLKIALLLAILLVEIVISAFYTLFHSWLCIFGILRSGRGLA